MTKEIKIKKEGNEYQWIQTRTITYTAQQMNDVLTGLKDNLDKKKNELAKLEVDIPILEKDIAEIEKALA